MSHLRHTYSDCCMLCPTMHCQKPGGCRSPPADLPWSNELFLVEPRPIPLRLVGPFWREGASAYSHGILRLATSPWPQARDVSPESVLVQWDVFMGNEFSTTERVVGPSADESPRRLPPPFVPRRLAFRLPWPAPRRPTRVSTQRPMPRGTSLRANPFC